MLGSFQCRVLHTVGKMRKTVRQTVWCEKLGVCVTARLSKKPFLPGQLTTSHLLFFCAEPLFSDVTCVAFWLHNWTVPSQRRQLWFQVSRSMDQRSGNSIKYLNVCRKESFDGGYVRNCESVACETHLSPVKHVCLQWSRFVCLASTLTVALHPSVVGCAEHGRAVILESWCLWGNDKCSSSLVAVNGSFWKVLVTCHAVGKSWKSQTRHLSLPENYIYPWRKQRTWIRMVKFE